MKLKEINKVIQEWASEGEGADSKRSVIFIALDRVEEIHGEEKREGTTTVQLIGSSRNLVKSLADALGEDSTPIKEIIGGAIEIDIKKRICKGVFDNLDEFFKEMKKEQKGESK